MSYLWPRDAAFATKQTSLALEPGGIFFFSLNSKYPKPIILPETAVLIPTTKSLHRIGLSRVHFTPNALPTCSRSPPPMIIFCLFTRSEIPAKKYVRISWQECGPPWPGPRHPAVWVSKAKGTSPPLEERIQSRCDVGRVQSDSPMPSAPRHATPRVSSRFPAPQVTLMGQGAGQCRTGALGRRPAAPGRAARLRGVLRVCPVYS